MDSESWKALLVHKILITATVAVGTLIVYGTPIGDVRNGTAFASKGGGDGKSPKPPGGGHDISDDDDDGDYGHAVKPPKSPIPHK
jgi:hypothetical protein